jgi:hypothetical protein
VLCGCDNDSIQQGSETRHEEGSLCCKCARGLNLERVRMMWPACVCVHTSAAAVAHRVRLCMLCQHLQCCMLSLELLQLQAVLCGLQAQHARRPQQQHTCEFWWSRRQQRTRTCVSCTHGGLLAQHAHRGC